MLTNEHLRVKREEGHVVPRFLDAAARRRLLPVAAALIDIVGGLIGSRREEIENALAAVDHPPRDRLAVDGLEKLLIDRCDFAVDERVEPMTVRHEVFRRAAHARRELGPGQAFDRNAALDQAATLLAIEDRAVLEELLFADLRANERLVGVRTITPEALLDRYDLALAQGVLLRATRVQVALDGESPGRVRELFRAARFQGLLHRVRQLDETRYLIELDGPYSLFSAVQKYGIKLAMFLPSVVRCARWRLRADVLWGKRRDPLVFELGPEQGLRADDRPVTGVAPEVREFAFRFAELGSRWQVAPNERIFALPGEVVCVPDLVFTNLDTGEEVYLEGFGFWSRDAVWRRIDMLRRGFPARIILAVGKQLRVSEEVLEDTDAAELYVYAGSMRPRAVHERLEASRS